MNHKLIALIVGLVVMVPLMAYGYSLSDQYIIVKSFDKDSLPVCDKEGMIIYSKNNQNLLVCTQEGYRLPDGTLMK